MWVDFTQNSNDLNDGAWLICLIIEVGKMLRIRFLSSSRQEIVWSFFFVSFLKRCTCLLVYVYRFYFFATNFTEFLYQWFINPVNFFQQNLLFFLHLECVVFSNYFGLINHFTLIIKLWQILNYFILRKSILLIAVTPTNFNMW